MAVIVPQPQAVEPPVWPSLGDAALDSVRVEYDPEIDYLYVFLYGEPLPAVWDPRPDGDTGWDCAWSRTTGSTRLSRS